MKNLSEEEHDGTPVRDPVKEAAAIAEAVIQNFRGLIAVEKAKFEIKLRHLLWGVLTITYLALLLLFALGGFVFMLIWGSMLLLTDFGISPAVASLLVGGVPLIIVSVAIFIIQKSDKAKSMEAKVKHLRQKNVIRDREGADELH